MRLSEPSRLGPLRNRLTVRVPKNHDRSDSETYEAPKPNPLHRTFERDVKSRVDDARHGVTADQQKQAGPIRLTPKARIDKCCSHRREPTEKKEDPDHQTGHTRSSEQGHVGVMRASQWTRVARTSVTIFDGEIDPESATRPEMRSAVQRVLQDQIPPLDTPNPR